MRGNANYHGRILGGIWIAYCAYQIFAILSFLSDPRVEFANIAGVLSIVLIGVLVGIACIVGGKFATAVSLVVAFFPLLFANDAGHLVMPAVLIIYSIYILVRGPERRHPENAPITWLDPHDDEVPSDETKLEDTAGWTKVWVQADPSQPGGHPED